MKRLILTTIMLCTIELMGATYNIKDYGAVADGITLSSSSIQKAIDACTQAGGGTVLVPEGTYLCGTIELKSNVTLRLEKGSCLLGSTKLSDYKIVDPFTDGLGIELGRTFIAAVRADNIAIVGEGTIDGQGSEIKRIHIQTDLRPEGKRWGERPLLLRVVRCNGVRIDGINLNYSASWTSHYAQSYNINISRVTIRSIGVAHNDGINIDGCDGVKISTCDIVSGDDALCFKTTSSLYPCRNIVVRSMRLRSNQAGIKMGTESMAPFENILITDCYIYDTNNGGIKLFSVDGALLQNVEISDIMMENVRTPIIMRLGSRLSVFRKGEQRQPTGVLRNVKLSNIKAISAEKTQLTSASAILITGVPDHLIENVTIENIDITLPGGGTADQAEHQVPEAIDEYPEVKTFGPIIPAYGIWLRHVKGIAMQDIVISTKKDDMRPAVVCEDAHNVTITALKTPPQVGSQPKLVTKKSSNVVIK